MCVRGAAATVTLLAPALRGAAECCRLEPSPQLPERPQATRTGAAKRGVLWLIAARFFVSARPALHRSPLAARSSAREPVRRPRRLWQQAISKRNTRPSAGSVAADTFIGHLNLSKSLEQRSWERLARAYTRLDWPSLRVLFADATSLGGHLEASTGAIRGHGRPPGPAGSRHCKIAASTKPANPRASFCGDASSNQSSGRLKSRQGTNFIKLLHPPQPLRRRRERRHERLILF